MSVETRYAVRYVQHGTWALDGTYPEREKRMAETRYDFMVDQKLGYNGVTAVILSEMHIETKHKTLRASTPMHRHPAHPGPGKMFPTVDVVQGNDEHGFIIREPGRVDDDPEETVPPENIPPTGNTAPPWENAPANGWLD